MEYRFNRQVQLIIQSDSGIFDLSDFRITFQVTHASVSTPKTLRARIYNLSHGGKGSNNTVSQIQTATNKVVTLAAYYEGQAPAILFQGTIRQVYAGRESPVDTFLDIGAAVLEDFYATATVSSVLGAGWTHSEFFLNALISTNAARYGVRAGVFPQLSGNGSRPKVCYGNARDALRALARNSNSLVVQHDTGHIDMVPVQNTAATTKPTDQHLFLSPKNGLINTPIQIPEGIQATALLDNRLKLGATVEIYSLNNSDSVTAVTQEDLDMTYAGTNGGNTTTDAYGNSSVRGLSRTGVYTILFVDHTGDTRGETWYTTLVGQAIDPSDQPVTTSRAAGVTG